MKVILVVGYMGDPIGVYTFERFKKCLLYIMTTANKNNEWEKWLVYIMDSDNAEFDKYVALFAIYRNLKGECFWQISDKYVTYEEFIKVIEDLLPEEDDEKTKQLRIEISSYKNRIEYLENHIKYMPEGEGAIKAKEHFMCLIEGN